MIAKSFDILDRRRSSVLDLASINDFSLVERGQIGAEEILGNQCISLYTLDFEQGLAVFVETPASVDLSRASFYYVSQYEHATRVMTLPLPAVVQLARPIRLDGSQLIFIHSVGRAGSTLASQIFGEVRNLSSISEPDALTWLSIAHNIQPERKASLLILLDAAVKLLCKGGNNDRWVIKGRSFVIQLGEWLHELYPRAKNLFLYRDAESCLGSFLRAFDDGRELSPDERRKAEVEARKTMAHGVPLIARYDPARHLSEVGILTLSWLSVMDKWREMQRSGIEMLPIDYNDWRTKPRDTAQQMLKYCECLPEDMSAVYAALDRDSQEGTFLAGSKVRNNRRVLTDEDIKELNRILHEHGKHPSGDSGVDENTVVPDGVYY